LTNFLVNGIIALMNDLAVIENPAAAEVSLDAIRTRLLAELAEPGSATSLSKRVGLSRQKINYHLTTLEKHGLVELVEERKRGNFIERVMRSTARSYVISPAALAPLQPNPAIAPDKLSARWLVAVAAKLVRDVGHLINRATDTNKRVATFAIDGEIRFATASDRAAFAAELSDAVAELVSKYHDETTEGGRPHRLVVAIHPSVRSEGESSGAA
jgi:DNA-binding transcriptional ArsR family regulator